MHSLINTIPPARYFPFTSGKYTTEPGLHKLNTDFGNGNADQRIFQLDAMWPHFAENKRHCRSENIDKYYKVHQLKESTAQQLTRFIIDQLMRHYPSLFSLVKSNKHTTFINRLNQESISFDYHYHLVGESKFVSTLDALASQVQEDMAVWQLDGNADWMALIHLCAPNHWSAAEKIGKPFSAVHQPVAGMEKMRQRYQPMLRTLIRGGNFVRFAWGLSTDKRLNHHPEPAEGVNSEEWQGRSFEPENPNLYVRIERQTLSGFPEADAVLFTIRTYFEDVKILTPTHRKALLHALDTMSAQAIAYKGLTYDLESIQDYLQRL